MPKSPTFMRRKLEEINTKCNEAIKAAEKGAEISAGVSSYIIRDLATNTSGQKVNALSARIGSQGREYESIAGKIVYIREQVMLMLEELKNE